VVEAGASIVPQESALKKTYEKPSLVRKGKLNNVTAAGQSGVILVP
jgi:hypothetical protein